MAPNPPSSTRNPPEEAAACQRARDRVARKCLRELAATIERDTNSDQFDAATTIERARQLLGLIDAERREQ